MTYERKQSLLPEDSAFIEASFFEKTGWELLGRTISQALPDEDAAYIYSNCREANISYQLAIAEVLSYYSVVPNEIPLEFFFDEHAVVWSDGCGESASMPPSTSSFSDSYHRMYPDSGHAPKSVTLVVTEDCMLRCTYCVDGDTPVLLPDGTTVAIKDVAVGDEVMGFLENLSPEEGVTFAPASVTKVFQRVADARRVYLENGDILTITPNHRVVANREMEWREIGSLAKGDLIWKFVKDDDGYYTFMSVAIAAVEPNIGAIDVYNLETSTGTYCANGYAVHNCYQHNKNDTYMTKDTARQIVDFLFDQDAKNNELINPEVAPALCLDFIGGEPFLAVDVMDEFMTYFLTRAVQLRHRWATHYMVSISSNGVLYDSPAVQSFLRKYAGRVSLTITIDGNKALHDACRRFEDGSPSYDIVRDSVEHYLQVNPNASTKLTLSPDNVQYTFDAIRSLYEDLNLRVVYANCVYEDVWNNECAALLYRELKKLADWIVDNDLSTQFYCSLFSDYLGNAINPDSEEGTRNYCGGTGEMLSFTADGGIQPCVRYTKFNLNGKQPELRLGTLTDGLLESDEARGVYAALNSITRQSQSTDECLNCPIATGCGWCSALNYEMYGTPNKRSTAICPMHKARVLANSYYFNRNYSTHGIGTPLPLNIPDEWALEIIDSEELQMLKTLASSTA